ncbi:helix-turn-helix protein [Murinocardiopsis flavida]|uniref:Helix-turn-helix protein n=1 Tax=Murinocardiopsis flavida TaxID=645275 RepID=A0A2P8DGA4_9ACTN|nr:helix-turn-helix transcriptional regulator [Murinocardiopsis flavida]PSK96243.1 helix-turn-helix protein [Murinocardiopsis flavida]
MDPTSTPAVDRALLTEALNNLRREAGLTQEQVAKEAGWSPAKLIRLESGKQVIGKADLKELLGQYGLASTPHGTELIELALRASRRGWPEQHRALLEPGYLRYIGLEAGAAVIRESHNLVISGLLQTPEYAHAVVEGNPAVADPDTIVDVRLRRQEELRSRARPPQEIHIVDEAAIRRYVGGEGTGIMRRQLEYMIELAAQPRIDIRIVPYTAGYHPGLHEPVVILEYEVRLNPMLFKETSGRILHYTDPEVVSRCQSKFTRVLTSMCLSAEESKQMIADSARTM